MKKDSYVLENIIFISAKRDRLFSGIIDRVPMFPKRQTHCSKNVARCLEDFPSLAGSYQIAWSWKTPQIIHCMKIQLWYSSRQWAVAEIQPNAGRLAQIDIV